MTNWKRKLGEYLTEVLGTEIAPCRIYQCSRLDKNFFIFDEFPKIERFHPIILTMYEKNAVVIPDEDFQELELGMEICTYINYAHWNIGYLSNFAISSFWGPIDLKDPDLQSNKMNIYKIFYNKENYGRRLVKWICEAIEHKYDKDVKMVHLHSKPDVHICIDDETDEAVVSIPNQVFAKLLFKPEEDVFSAEMNNLNYVFLTK